MRTRRTSFLTGTAVAGAAGLLLSGCAGGGSVSSDEIKGADQGGATPTPEASADAEGRPPVTLPKGFQADFEGWASSDPKLRAILGDGRQRLRAGYAAIMKGDPKDPSLKFFSAGAALKSAPSWVGTYEGLTLVGKVRVFDPQVRLNEEGFGTLFYCVDESRAYSKNLRTGKTVGTPEGQDPNVLYRTRLDEYSGGVWKTTSVEADRGGCRK